MGHGGDFAALFRLALLALGLSKTRAAALLSVDKSLVGRWAAGAVRPTQHNLTRITALVAGRSKGSRCRTGIAGRTISPAWSVSTPSWPGVAWPLQP